MNETEQNMVLSGGILDTLANGGTNTSDEYNSELLHKLVGKGTGKESMKKRPTKKMLDQHLVLALIDVAKKNGDLEMIKKYWNTWHCFSTIKTDGKRAYGHYCGNRFCSVCSGNRKAHLINQYLPIINQWSEPWFLTLTRTAVRKTFLKETIQDNNIKFKRIIDRLNKRFQRSKGPKIIALRSTECNFNPVDKTYNPHYHIIVPSREVGKLLLTEWLKEQNKGQKKKVARPFAQDLRIIKDREKNLLEVIKYGVKVMSDPDMKKGKNRTQLPIIYAAALHEIHKAFSSVHLLSKYGFKLAKVEKEVVTNYVVDSNIKSWEYDPSFTSYIETSTAEIMHPKQFLPSAEVEYIAKERLDKESC